MRVARWGAAAGIPAAIAAAATAAFIAAPANAQDADAANEALKKGDTPEARAQLEQAVKHNPSDYNIILSYASTLPPKDALKTADSISRAPNAPGWAKARALRISGDHRFLKEDYKKAADAYLQASKLDSASIYKLLYALSAAVDGQTEAARAVWNEIAANQDDEHCGEAARMLALLPKPTPTGQTAVAPIITQPNIASVQTSETPVSRPNSTPVSTPTNAATVDDAKKPATPVPVVNPPAVNPPAAPIDKQSNTQELTVKTPVNPNPQNNPTVSTPANVSKTVDDAKKTAEIIFTIQVGAFASRDNADNLVKRLTGKYDDITVTTAASGDQTLYRVRVGSFQKKEDAVVFADRLIIEAGLSARVTEK